MPAPTIAILTGSHLCHNPRVLKEAATLAGAGYQVEVMGGWIDPLLKARDLELMARINFSFRPLHDLTRQPVLRQAFRLRSRLAKLMHEKLGRESPYQLNYFVGALHQTVRRGHADLFIAHSEPALWAAAQGLNRPAAGGKRKCRMGLDMEDWFSEDLPADVRKYRPVNMLRNIERGVLCRGAHATCTSQAMGSALAADYGCRPPTVVYNAFPWSDRAGMDGQSKDRPNRAIPSIHWYSQTLGTDRGLGDLFAALPFLEQNVEIHLRGKPVAGFEHWLAAHLPANWRSQVFIHGLVSNAELLSRIGEHDLGFAGEQKHVSRNRDLTVTNKILHYLLGGLAVVASDTTGHQEVAEQAPAAVRIFSSGNPAQLAGEINALLSNPQCLHAAKTAALAAAQNIFCWERQESRLLQSVQTALR